jgi:hypothetical protein
MVQHTENSDGRLSLGQPKAPDATITDSGLAVGKMAHFMALNIFRLSPFFQPHSYPIRTI